jgi:sulfate adenylyltransferase
MNESAVMSKDAVKNHVAVKPKHPLVDCMLTAEQLQEYQPLLTKFASLKLTERQLCDLELLLNGGFSPLVGFMGQADYESVLHSMRLQAGTVWPMPIVLDVDDAFMNALTLQQMIVLRDAEGSPLALMEVESIWCPDKEKEADCVYGTRDRHHFGVNYLIHRTEKWYLGGKIFGIALPFHADYQYLRKTPRELRTFFEKNYWDKIVAFQTRNPIHRAHQMLTVKAAEEIGGHLLIHPVVGMTKTGDVDYITRVKCYEKVLNYYPKDLTALSLLPLAMRMAGPREAVWHAIIRKNYGCSHFIVGRDHAGPGKDQQGKPYYDPYAAQDLLRQHQDEIGIVMMPFQEFVYVKESQAYLPVDECPPGQTTLTLSGTEFRDCLQAGRAVPEWFSFPEVVAQLRKRYPLKHERGFTVFFTGLSGAGKSTLAQVLVYELMRLTDRNVTLLDGDHVRNLLSSELGFSREHRDLNILRIGYVASEITKNGGIAICAPIAPYAETRQRVRDAIESHGGFIEVFVATPLAECERRDRKGLYAKARQGIIKHFTGIDDPYEKPGSAEIVLETTETSPLQCVQAIIAKLVALGYLS